jgi:hypothetical protein
MIATFRPAIASAAAMLTPIALFPTPPLALAIATTARTSGSFMIGAAPFSALAPAGVLSDRASQKILVVNDTFPGNYRPSVPTVRPAHTISARRPKVTLRSPIKRAPLQN